MYLIFVATIFKVINIKDIDYEDGVIKNINGISFKDKEIILDRDIYTNETPFRKVVIVDKKLMSDNWSKYLTNIKKT